MTELDTWIHQFPDLEHVNDPEGLRALQSAMLRTFPADSTLFRTHDRCDYYFLLLEGSVRVQQLSISGREIVLYRIAPGESCVLTTSCLLARRHHYTAEGITETKCRAILIPATRFHKAIESSTPWQQFVFATYGERLTDLLRLVDEIAFERLNVRLSRKILDLSRGNNELETTHQQLASEIGSAREVVSRLLKGFSQKNWIQIERGIIHIIDRDALAKEAEPLGITSFNSIN